MKRLLAFCALVLLAACSKDKDIAPPAELVDFPATVAVKRVWTASVGGDGERLRLGLGLGVDEARVYGAGHDGEVAAFELHSGRALWRTRTRSPLSGGTGVGEGLVVVGSAKGEVIALSAEDGAIRWRRKVGGEILSAPAVSARSVIVRTVDGRLHGLALADGHALWQQEQQVPRLTLRGTATPVIAGDEAICGFDNGRVVAVNVASGDQVWETMVAPPRGRTELERLVDVDSAVQVRGEDVYVVGFQGRVAMLARDTGQIWWSRELSSYRGLDVDDDALYVSTSDGEIVALRRRTGVELWRQNMLARRGLSAPAVSADGTLAVGDFQGYVHWFGRATGAPAARASAGARITNPPRVAGDLLFVIDETGRITAFRVAPLPGAQNP